MSYIGQKIIDELNRVTSLNRGSYTFGKTMDEQNIGRSEAEFRAEREAKQKGTGREQK